MGQRARLVSEGVAAALALLLLSGRWRLDRVFDTDEELGIWTEPRLWLVGACVVLALLPLQRSTRGRQALVHGILALGTCSLFLLYMMASALWSPELAAAAPKLYEVALLLVTSLCAYRIASLTGRSRLVAALLRWVLWGCGALVLAALVLGGDGRTAVFGGGPNIFGRNAGIFLVLCLARALESRRPAPWITGALVAAVMVLLSGSRGALLATSLGALALLWYVRPRPRLGRLGYLALIAALFGVWILGFTEAGDRAVYMFQERVMRLLVVERYDAGRTDLYLLAYDLGMAHPLVGVGLAGFSFLGLGVYPHNLELEVFAEGGLIGLVLLTLALAPACVKLATRAGRLPIAAPAVFVLLLFASQFSGDLYDARGALLLALLLALPGVSDQPGDALAASSR